MITRLHRSSCTPAVLFEAHNIIADAAPRHGICVDYISFDSEDLFDARDEFTVAAHFSSTEDQGRKKNSN